MLITHDIGVIAETTNRVAVMYAGRIVEAGPTADVLARPLHPYTLGLLRSAVDLGVDVTAPQPIPGSLPDPLRRPAGCAFHPRCYLASQECQTADVALVPVDDGHTSACLHVAALLGDRQGVACD